MLDEPIGRLPQQFAHFVGNNPGLFDQVHHYVCDSLDRITLKDPSQKDVPCTNPAPEIRKLILIGEFEEAYEWLHVLVKDNDLSEFVFLGLAVTNLHLGYPEAAEKYASQAAKLHGLVGDGSHTAVLDAYVDALHDLVQEWRASKITVNDRFINLYPTQPQLERDNAVDKYLMQGLAPAKPFITKSDKIATVGSCFTGNISTFLRHNGYDIPRISTAYEGNFPTGSFSDEVFNTYVLRYLFELAFDVETEAPEHYDSINQHNLKTTVPVTEIRNALQGASLFIMTLGMSEVWFNKQTGEVYRTAKSVGDYDPEIHDFRVTSVQENFENIDFVCKLIRAHTPDAPIIFTLSPVPLKATFREIGCTVANSVSKATLRVALDELLRARSDDTNLHYFPSYELIQDCLPHPFAGDRRYITKDTVEFAMKLFARHYIVTEDAPA